MGRFLSSDECCHLYALSYCRTQKKRNSMDTTRLKTAARRESSGYTRESSSKNRYDEITIYDLPDSLLLYIFSFLEPANVLTVISTCKWFYEIGNDECLWRNLTFREWGPECTKAPFVNTWLEEYKHLHCHAPVMLSEELCEHSDEIFHISFSHNGKLFTTTGKDGSVKVWEIGCPTKLKYTYNLTQDAGWNYTRYSAFNKDDTNLLVSGLRFHCGWVAWFSLVDGFTLTWTDVMTPQGMRGAWLSNHRLLYGLQSETEEAVDLCVEWEGANGSHTEDGEPQHIQEISFDVTIRIQFLNVVRRKHMMASDSLFNSVNNDYHNTNDSQNRNQMNNDYYLSKQENGYTLVFATGYCDALNQIGIKYISKSKLRSVIRQGNNDSNNRRQGEVIRGRPSIKRKQNAHCDYLIDLHGQILGMRVSMNSRYLVVNMRRWIEEPDGSDPYERPELSKNMEIRLVDLFSLKVDQMVYTGHKAVSDTDSFCFCFGDANKDFVVCGSESYQAFIWDRHSGVLLSTLDHLMAGVSAAAINPVDQEFVVSVGDDQVVRVWRSRVKQKQYLKQCATLDIDAGDMEYNKPSDQDYSTRL
ncbi:hypothetical protein LOTGIDRAFT_152090 [Lottia gigantea]|uniref:F-box domain-containing protein n=1 Tax=Lottia gigantea TaxID=225164 RepID=V4AM46_LOTGI|nr:hypothetical protein LOTGIDRAFT_152090 [Lottia gigantea]ESP05264.1 hypothetical protein LOTGIDRAFT_152090 [Lottia gigantea]